MRRDLGTPSSLPSNFSSSLEPYRNWRRGRGRGLGFLLSKLVHISSILWVQAHENRDPGRKAAAFAGSLSWPGSDILPRSSTSGRRSPVQGVATGETLGGSWLSSSSSSSSSIPTSPWSRDGKTMTTRTPPRHRVLLQAWWGGNRGSDSVDKSNHPGQDRIQIQGALLDGAEWATIQAYLLLEEQQPRRQPPAPVSQSEPSPTPVPAVVVEFPSLVGATDDHQSSPGPQDEADQEKMNLAPISSTEKDSSSNNNNNNQTTTSPAPPLSLDDYWPPWSTSWKTLSQAYVSIVTGRHQENQRIVAMQVPPPLVQAMIRAQVNLSDHDRVMVPLLDQQQEDVWVYRDTMAVLPAHITAPQAAATFWQAMSAVHLVAQPILTVSNVGGSNQSLAWSRSTNGRARVVIVGGGDLSWTAAQALRVLRCNVTIVTTDPKAAAKKSPSKSSTSSHSSMGSLTVWGPSVVNPQPTPRVKRTDDGDDDDEEEENLVGFCQALQRFDAMLDTLSNEKQGLTSVGSSIMSLLQDRHGCSNYVSTMSKQQDLIGQSGVFAGPKQVKEYIQQSQESLTRMMQQQQQQRPAAGAAPREQMAWCPPLPGLGQTVQTLLDHQVLFPVPNTGNNNKKFNLWIRGWNLADFWEYTTWPRDTTGAATVRYGFPVVEDLFDAQDDLFTEPSLIDDDESMSLSDRVQKLLKRRRRMDEPAPEDQAEPGTDSAASSSVEEENPFVMNVVGVQGMQEKIIDPQIDCLLFLSAPFCRTCRYLQPMYQRMARVASTTPSNKIVFAKADAVGRLGKELGRALLVDAVPTFVLFKAGKLYGNPLSISRLPSQQLDQALQDLQAGKPANLAIFREGQNGGNGGERRRGTKF